MRRRRRWRWIGFRTGRGGGLARLPASPALPRAPRVAFIGVDHQDQRGPALDLLRRTGLTYPTTFDPQGDVATAYGLRGMPTTIFISPEREIRELHTGEMAEHALEARSGNCFCREGRGGCVKL